MSSNIKKILFIPVAFILACQPQPSSKKETSDSSLQQYLLYISSRGNGFDIYQNNVSGTNEVMLTGQGGWEWAPLWIPSEKKIIYNSQDTAGVFSIKAMDSKGGSLELDTQGLEEYILSPDGKRVAFTNSDEDNAYIYVLDLAALQDTLKITNVEAYNGRPTWSPNSAQIVYISNRSGSNEIYLYDFPSGETKRITENDVREKYLSWSPDGTQIVTSMQTGEEPNDLFIITLSNLSIFQLTETDINESEISWSPLGDKIAYHAQVDEKDDIYLIDVVSKEVSQVTHGEGYHGEPTWMLVE